MAFALNASRPRALFAITFLAVAREGVETALLLVAAVFATDAFNTITGSLLGFGIAALIGVLLYASTLRLNMRVFFNVTGILLLLFAAGLLARSVHEFQEAGVLMTIQEHIWNLEPLLPQDSTLGQILRTLFGYSSAPSLLEAIAYAGYWIVALLGVPWLVNRQQSSQTTTTRAERLSAV
jgi:high-affinity iron transporter